MMAKANRVFKFCIVGAICDGRRVSPDGGFVPDRWLRPERRELR
jgi:hypothetical protein